MARGTRKVRVKALWGREQTALREEFNEALGELDDMRTKYAALLTKLDADSGVGGTDYGTTCALAAVSAEKVE